MDSKKRKEIEEQSPDTLENRERKSLVSLNGTAVTESGKLTKSNYFRFLNHNLDDYDDIVMTPEEAKKVHNHLQKLSTGSQAMVPLYCAGPACIFATTCPLQKINKAPIGKQCILENELLKEWTMRYFEEYDIDPNNFTEIGYINELAEINVMEMRINQQLARPENASLLKEEVAGFSRDGEPIYQSVINPLVEQKEKLSNRKSKIIKLMVGDRQEKYKKEAALKIRQDSDPSSSMAAARQKIESLKRGLDALDSKSKLTPEDLIASLDNDKK
jgi:hypothetical protein